MTQKLWQAYDALMTMGYTEAAEVVKREALCSGDVKSEHTDTLITTEQRRLLSAANEWADHFRFTVDDFCKMAPISRTIAMFGLRPLEVLRGTEKQLARSACDKIQFAIEHRSKLR